MVSFVWSSFTSTYWKQHSIILSIKAIVLPILLTQLIPCFCSSGYFIILLLKYLLFYKSGKTWGKKKKATHFFSPERIASFFIEVLFVLENVT